jgi:hypothetical protein
MQPVNDTLGPNLETGRYQMRYFRDQMGLREEIKIEIR